MSKFRTAKHSALLKLFFVTVILGAGLVGALRAVSITQASAPPPSWWSGDCDVGNNPGSHALGASYNGVEACGPGPVQGGTDVLVRFFPGAWGEDEWECVELAMRYMYLVYGIHPYDANGSQVVSNYSGNLLTKVPNNGASLPAPGDIISEGATDTPGHTAIVTEVKVNNGVGTITIMQQNATSDGWGTIAVSGNMLGSGVTGWLHHPTDSAASPSRPAALSFNGALHVFVREGDNQLSTESWDGSSWSGWTSLGGGFAGDPAVISNGKALNVFILGSDGQVYTAANPGTGWSPWAALKAPVLLVGNPRAIQYQNKLYVFAQGSDTHPYVNVWSDSAGWAGFTAMEASIASDLVPVVYGAELDLFARGANNQLFQNTTLDGVSWTGFSSLGGSLAGAPVPLSYAGQLAIWARDSSGEVWQLTKTGSTRSAWTEMGVALSGDPSLVQYGDDLEVFARTTNNQIQTRAWNASGQFWSAWASIDTGQTTLGDPRAIQDGSALDVFALDSNGVLYKATWNGTAWGAFAPLSPAPSATPSPTPSATPSGSSCPPVAGHEDTATEAWLLNAVNQARADAGLAALTIDPLIHDEALQHSAAMTCYGMSHYVPPGTTPQSRMKAAGVKFVWAGENIGWSGQGTNMDKIMWLFNSMMSEQPPNDAHRKNFLSPHFSRTGIGIYVENASGRLWLTEDFAG